ncbi:MAG: tetratricopeptide repeat protein [Myxococcota bacterium]
MHRTGWLVAFVMVGCRTTSTATPPPLPTTPAPEPAEAAPDPVEKAPVHEPIARAPGFVVFGFDETFIIPLDPDAEVQRYPGWAMGRDESTMELRMPVDWLEERSPGIPYCADDVGCARDDASFEVTLTTNLLGDATWTAQDDGGDACSCIVVTGLSDEWAPDDEARYEAMLADDLEELEMSSLSAEDYIDKCLGDGLEPGPVSMVGGVAYHLGWYNGVECGGGNIYALGGYAVELRPDAESEDVAADATFRCTEGVPDSSSIVSLYLETEDADWCDYDDAGPDDSSCSLWNEDASGLGLVNGKLLRLVGDVNPAGGDEMSCVQAVPLDPDHCPSAYDPCGDPTPFPATATAQAWWVATDGSSALLLEDGLATVHRPEQAGPVREVDVLPPLERIMGVEFHAAVPQAQREFPEEVAVAVPTLDDVPAAAGTFGNACFKVFKAGKLDQAEAYCVAGLRDNAGSGDDAARGAMLYSLGRIEEARGNSDRARSLYQRSLAVRPGNEGVQSRLDGLSRGN